MIFASSSLRVLVDGDGVQVHDAVDALVVVLQPDPVLEGAQVIPDVQIAGRLDTGEDSWFHARGGESPILRDAAA